MTYIMIINTILNINKHGCITNITKYQTVTRQFFGWLIIIFNNVDKNRIKCVGPDQACAEWLLRNGAFVKPLGTTHYLKDYNLLCKKNSNFYIQTIDATDSSIHHVGFQHFWCKHIKEMKIIRCPYIENEALSLLSLVKDSLKILEILECKNITDEGLLHLKNLIYLKTLKLGGMPYIQNKLNIILELNIALPNCKIIYD